MKIKRRILEKVKRNDKVLKDYNNLMPIKDIMKKYKISKARVYQILKRFEKE